MRKKENIPTTPTAPSASIVGPVPSVLAVGAGYLDIIFLSPIISLPFLLHSERRFNID